MDIRLFAQKVRLKQEELAATIPAKDVYIMSLDSDDKGTVAGVVACMPRHIAARCIVEMTGRVATPAEIKAQEADQIARGEAIRREEMEKKFPLNLTVYPAQEGHNPKAERTGK